MMANGSRPSIASSRVRREPLRCPRIDEALRCQGARVAHPCLPKGLGARTPRGRCPRTPLPRVRRKGAKPPRRRERRRAASGDCAGVSRLSPSRKSGDRRLRPRRVPCTRKPLLFSNSSFSHAQWAKRRPPHANSPCNSSITRPGLRGSSGNTHSIAARRRATKTDAQPEQGQRGGRDQNAE